VDHDLFYTDPDQSDQHKRHREWFFNAIEVPRLRLLGFSIVTLLVALRHASVPDDPSRKPAGYRSIRSPSGSASG
jgi:hypothetical protein